MQSDGQTDSQTTSDPVLYRFCDAMRYDITHAEVGRLVCGVSGIDYIAVSVARK